MKLVMQVAMEVDIVLEPPESGPGKNNKFGSRLTQAFEFPNRRIIIRGLSPVLPLSFEKGDRPPLGERLRLKCRLVDKDKECAWWDDRRYCRLFTLTPLRELLGLVRLALRS